MRTAPSPCRLARGELRRTIPLSPCLLILFLVGCGGPKNYTFDVSLKNATDTPLTVGFIKRGPPSDPHWMSPEDWTNAPPSRQPESWGFVIPPGETFAERVTGEMSSGADPIVRIYAGTHPLNDLLAISHGAGDRLDLGLQPHGNNYFIITHNGPHGGLAARLRHRSPASQ
jgi:hypothetical protein